MFVFYLVHTANRTRHTHAQRQTHALCIAYHDTNSTQMRTHTDVGWQCDDTSKVSLGCTHTHTHTHSCKACALHKLHARSQIQYEKKKKNPCVSRSERQQNTDGASLLHFSQVDSISSNFSCVVGRSLNLFQFIEIFPLEIIRKCITPNGNEEMTEFEYMKSIRQLRIAEINFVDENLDFFVRHKISCRNNFNLVDRNDAAADQMNIKAKDAH